jgi:hypothetical protein
MKFMSENPQARWGRHVYSAARFGLSALAIEEEFRFYTERFNTTDGAAAICPT